MCWRHLRAIRRDDHVDRDASRAYPARIRAIPDVVRSGICYDAP